MKLCIHFSSQYCDTNQENLTEESVILKGIPLSEGLDGRQAILSKTLEFDITEEESTPFLIFWLNAMKVKAVISD